MVGPSFALSPALRLLLADLSKVWRRPESLCLCWSLGERGAEQPRGKTKGRQYFLQPWPPPGLYQQTSMQVVPGLQKAGLQKSRLPSWLLSSQHPPPRPGCLVIASAGCVSSRGREVGRVASRWWRLQSRVHIVSCVPGLF